MTSLRTKAFLARTKYRFFCGTGFASIGIGLLGILTFAKVWSATFEFYGINPTLAYLAIPALYIALCYFGGLAYELSGIQALEMSHQNRATNPEIMDLIAEVEKSNRRLERIMMLAGIEE